MGCIEAELASLPDRERELKLVVGLAKKRYYKQTQLVNNPNTGAREVGVWGT